MKGTQLTVIIIADATFAMLLNIRHLGLKYASIIYVCTYMTFIPLVSGAIRIDQNLDKNLGIHITVQKPIVFNQKH